MAELGISVGSELVVLDSEPWGRFCMAGAVLPLPPTAAGSSARDCSINLSQLGFKLGMSAIMHAITD
jgi:hypothetical protein